MSKSTLKLLFPTSSNNSRTKALSGPCSFDGRMLDFTFQFAYLHSSSCWAERSHFFHIRKVSHFCSHAHRSSLTHIPVWSHISQEQVTKTVSFEALSFLQRLYIYRKYPIWWALHASCGVGSPESSLHHLIPDSSLSVLLHCSPSWWRDFLSLPTKFMTLVSFISFCIAVLFWCASFLFLQNSSCIIFQAPSAFNKTS